VVLATGAGGLLFVGTGVLVVLAEAASVQQLCVLESFDTVVLRCDRGTLTLKPAVHT